ncbi:hypothetical protein BC829DRAFT_209561 [Chytridium lagenaria]|nr:hypothetical protein BC829DRAFT_209561 [Chytridium lagenaria]
MVLFSSMRRISSLVLILSSSPLLVSSAPTPAAVNVIDPVLDAQDKGIWNHPDLLSAAYNGSILERVKAAKAWGSIQVPEVIDPLIGLLKNDRDSAVVSAAAFALGMCF